MPKRERYEVIRFIERGNFCHASLDYVEGITLYDWVNGHQEIEKGLLYAWIKELLHQLVLFHKQRGAPDYGRLNPYHIIIMRKNTIALLANKETESVRALDKYFIPNESIQNADVYCFGKIIQFIMAHIQCEPHLSKREEYKLQKIVKKCLGANPKSRYEEIHMVPMNFVENQKFRLNKKTGISVAVFLIIIGLLGFVKGKAEIGINTSEKGNENIVTEQALYEEKKATKEFQDDSKEMFLQAGIDYFLESEDYGKSIQYLKKADLQQKKTNYYLTLAEFMQGDRTATDLQSLKRELSEELIEEMIGGRKERLALMRAYGVSGNEEEILKILEVTEMEKTKSMQEELPLKLQMEFERYLAQSYEMTGDLEEAVKCYDALCEMSDKAEEEMKDAKKKSMEIRIKYLGEVWNEKSVDEEKKLSEIRQMIARNPDIMEEESFKSFVNEKKIHIEEGKIWVEKNETTP